MAKWQRYDEGTDHEALAWMLGQASADLNAAPSSTAKQMALSARLGQTDRSARASSR